MSVKKLRDQHQNDIMSRMGQKTFFDNEYAFMSDRSFLPGIENILDRNSFGVNGMQSQRELCQKIDGQPIELFNPGVEDMRYAFMDGDKPKYPPKATAELWWELQAKQSILDFTEGHREVQNVLREVYSAGDSDLANRVAMAQGDINYSDPAVANNPLLNGGYIKIPGITQSNINSAIKNKVEQAISDGTGINVSKAASDINSAVGMIGDAFN